MNKLKIFLILLLVTTTLFIYGCNMNPASIVTEFPGDTTLTETHPTETETETETEGETYVYETYTMLSQWYEGRETSYGGPSLGFSSLDEYLKLREAVRQGDAETLKECTSEWTLDYDFSSSHEMLTFHRLLCDLVDSALFVWPDDSVELRSISVRPNGDYAMASYASSSGWYPVLSSSAHFFADEAHAESLRQEWLYDITIDGTRFSVYAIGFKEEYREIHRRGLHYSDRGLFEFVFRMDHVDFDPQTYDYEGWYLGTIDEYLEWTS